MNEFEYLLKQKESSLNLISADTKRLRHLIGEKVQTPDGIGMLLNHKPIDFNGLYFTDNKYWTVWYGMDNTQNHKVSWEYRSEEIEEIK